MSQHPEDKSKKSGGKSEPGKASNVKSGHGSPGISSTADAWRGTRSFIVEY